MFSLDAASRPIARRVAMIKSTTKSGAITYSTNSTRNILGDLMVASKETPLMSDLLGVSGKIFSGLAVTSDADDVLVTPRI